MKARGKTGLASKELRYLRSHRAKESHRAEKFSAAGTLPRLPRAALQNSASKCVTNAAGEVCVREEFSHEAGCERIERAAYFKINEVIAKQCAATVFKPTQACVVQETYDLHQSAAECSHFVLSTATCGATARNSSLYQCVDGVINDVLNPVNNSHTAITVLGSVAGAILASLMIYIGVKYARKKCATARQAHAAAHGAFTELTPLRAAQPSVSGAHAVALGT